MKRIVLDIIPRGKRVKTFIAADTLHAVHNTANETLVSAGFPNSARVQPVTTNLKNIEQQMRDHGLSLVQVKSDYAQSHINPNMVEAVRPQRFLGFPLPHRAIIHFKNGDTLKVREAKKRVELKFSLQP